MAHSHETTCPNCGTKVYIYDQPIGGGSGNKSKHIALNAILCYMKQ